MKMKRSIKRVASISVVLVLLLSISVNATSYYSAWKTTGQINGYSYKYRSGVGKTTNSVVGIASTKVSKSGVMVPDKYIGGRTLLYSTGGSLFKASDWDYNSGSASGMEFRGSYVKTLGSYYCIAKFKYKKNNTSYSKTYSGKATKSVVLSKSKSAQINTENVNSYELLPFAIKHMAPNGKTYGSGLCELTGQELPDMIEAIGEDGKTGYIMTEDLNNHDNDTYIDAKEYDLDPGEISTRYIPLYSINGKIIDRFVIYTEGGYEIKD